MNSPLFIALVLTGANALKPVLIDDTAYLAFARQIAANPLDPYGFSIFWYQAPQPAMEVLAPPVVPYWLGLGIGILGEHVALLKLWLFPFVWAFAWSLRELLRRFARGSDLLPVIAFSPAILPAINLMLDVPALAFGLAAAAIFVRAADRGSYRLAVAAGLLAALAAQTKYTMLVVPPVLVWFAVVHRQVKFAAAAVAVAVVAFAGWEWFLAEKYDRSHFLYHAASQQPTTKPDRSAIGLFLEEKQALAPPLAGHLGCLGIGIALVAVGSLGLARRWVLTVAAVWAIGFILVATFPYRWTVITPGPRPPATALTGVMVYWQFFGVASLASILGCVLLLLFRWNKGLSVRLNRDSLFLAGWFAIELAAYFVLTPFPAARRVMGLTVVGGIIVARVSSRVVRLDRARRPASWVVALGIGAGLAVAAIDMLDAFPEKDCAERAALFTAKALTGKGPQGSTVWFAGHWGFQYYCERAGMRPLVPGQSVLEPGDYLVVPVYPEPHGFYRPTMPQGTLRPPAGSAEQVSELWWDDWLSAQTVPNYYGGIDPVTGRDHPRLRVAIYRITRQWGAR